MERPLWIVVEDTFEGQTFEGHQGHWRDVFFSNATHDAIIAYCSDEGYKFKISPMTPEQLEQFPEIIGIIKELNEEYNI